MIREPLLEDVHGVVQLFQVEEAADVGVYTRLVQSEPGRQASQLNVL